MLSLTRVTTFACALTVVACGADESGLSDGADSIGGPGDSSGQTPGGDNSGGGNGQAGDGDGFGNPGNGQVGDGDGSGAGDGDGDSSGDGDGTGAASCAGKPGKPGLSTRQVLGHNVQLYIPESLDANKPVPLLLVHHGLLMSGEMMKETTGFMAVADREGFAVAFPDGLAGGFLNATTWNAGADLCGGAGIAAGTSDDLAFVRELVASIQADQCISSDHIFATGFSMGGFFSSHLGCQLDDLIRGIAPHSGGTYPGDCPAKNPKPVMIWHGTTDTTVSVSCGADARDKWVARNGCDTAFDSVDIKGGKCEWHRGCPEGAQVVYCSVSGGHQWSGGSGLIGATGTESASELIWKFFKEQSGL